MKSLPDTSVPMKEQYTVTIPKWRVNWSGWMKPIIILALGLCLLLILNSIQRDTQWGPEETRPVARMAALVLGSLSLWAVFNTASAFLKDHKQVAWRMSVRLVGWVGVLAGMIATAVFMMQAEGGEKMPMAGAVRAVESIIPLVVGIQAAFLLSPDDEPGMEVLLTCPRHVSWLLLERLGVVLLSQGGIALVGTVVSISLTGERDLLAVAARWFAPALFFGGVAAYTTLTSRQPVFSVAVIGILWFLFNFVGGALLPGQPTFWPLSLIQPFLWPIHPYLQPADLTIGDWWLNRALVSALGVALIWLSVRGLRDEERVLLGGARVKTQAKGA